MLCMWSSMTSVSIPDEIKFILSVVVLLLLSQIEM